MNIKEKLKFIDCNQLSEGSGVFLCNKWTKCAQTCSQEHCQLLYKLRFIRYWKLKTKLCNNNDLFAMIQEIWNSWIFYTFISKLSISILIA